MLRILGVSLREIEGSPAEAKAGKPKKGPSNCAQAFFL
jgi:hypothetical protein